MVVTQIAQKGKTRVLVELDEERRIVLTVSSAARYGLQEGTELPKEVLQELFRELRSSAIRKCGSLLKNRDYTERGLMQKLSQAGYPESVVEETILEMKKAGYLNDRRYAENYLQYHGMDRARNRMRMELREKGIPEPLLEEVYRDWEAENAEQIDACEIEQIHALMRRRRYNPDSASPEDEQKLTVFLKGKGYGYEIIRAALHRFEM